MPGDAVPEPVAAVPQFEAADALPRASGVEAGGTAQSRVRTVAGTESWASEQLGKRNGRFERILSGYSARIREIVNVRCSRARDSAIALRRLQC